MDGVWRSGSAPVLGTGGRRFDPAHPDHMKIGVAPGVSHFLLLFTHSSRAGPEMQNDWWKRPFDLLVLTAVHVALAPVWMILWTVIPLAIWLHDRGPVFYTQERLGKNGRAFKVYKFRSMIPDAERHTGVVWAEDDDPRITPIGAFLRSRALDELPQVINMWKGDISLVGPRAERPELSEEFEAIYPGFARRLKVRPGMTGLAQIYGRYSTHPRNKLRYDMIYIRRMSPWLDVRLLASSVILTLRARWQSEQR